MASKSASPRGAAKPAKPKPKPAKAASKRGGRSSSTPRKAPAKKATKKARKAPAKKATKKRATKRPAAARFVDGTNTAAVEATIEALDKAHKIDPERSAVVTLVRRLAAAVDVAPDNASLWREYRQALSMLLGDYDPEHGGNNDGPTELDDLRRLLAE